MKNVLKKGLSILLVLIMIIGTIPNLFTNVNAASNIIINGVDIGYSNGSYFTKNGKSCANNYWASGRCHKNGVCDAATHSQCNCMRYWPTGNPNTCTVDLKASQCFGFARYCQYIVYGYYDISKPSYFTNITGSISSGNCTASTLKSKLLNCAPATHVRTATSGKGYGHSICIVSTSDYGADFADCNSDGYCKVRYKTYSWAELASYLKAYGGVSYANAWNQGSTPSVPTPPQNTDSVAPVISEVKLANMAENGYVVTAKVSDNVGVKEVFFPTWISGQTGDNAKWLLGSYNSSTGLWECWMPVSNWGNHYGTYYTHVYAYDAAGNRTGDGRLGEIRVPKLNSNSEVLASSGTYDLSKQQTIDAGGWVYNRNGDNVKVHYRIDNGAWTTFNLVDRADVPAQLPDCKQVKCGYYKDISIANLTSGQHIIDIIAESDGMTKVVASKTFTVVRPKAYGNFTFNANGGTLGSSGSFKVAYGNSFQILNTTCTRSGYTWGGWQVKRTTDNKWFVDGRGWCTESDINKYGYTKKIYDNYETHTLNDSWVSGLTGDCSYTFYAVWIKNRVSKFHVFVSPLGEGANYLSAKNNESGSGYAQDWVYAWFLMFDETTGDLFNTYDNRTYSVELSIIDPDGEVVHSCSYDNSDNNWIGYRPQKSGRYTAKAVLSGDMNYTVYAYYDVSYNPKLSSSLEAVPLTLNGTNSKQTTISISGNYPGSCSVSYSIADDDIASATWGKWDGLNIPLTITGKRIGTTNISISLHENYTAEKKIVKTITIPVIVGVDSTTINVNTSNSAVISKSSEMKYYTYTPQETGTYVIYSTGTEDTKVFLYDMLGNELSVDDDGGEVDNFRLEYNLTAGTKYLFGIKYYNSSKTGTISFKFGKTYKITYNANSGTGAPSAGIKDFGAVATLSSDVPTKTGYTFLGWNTKADGTGTNYASGSTYKIDEDVTLYAQWELITYTISYDGNGGTGVHSKQTKKYNVDFELSTVTPIRTGYTFKNWNTKADGTGTSYDPGEVYRANADLNLYAQWNANTYRVTFDAMGGVFSGGYVSSSYSMYICYNQPYGVLPAVTKTGYSFGGWYTQQGTRITETTKYTLTENQTLYARWKTDTYNIIYNVNGGSGAPSSQTKSYGIAITLSSVKPTRTGYTFMGWNTKADGTGDSYAPGGIYENEGSVTLYAQWKINTYTVSYNANGGAGSPDAQIKTFGTNLTLSSVKPTRAYYTFTGWNTKADGTGTSYAAGATYTINEDVTLYAQWKGNTYTITFDAGDGTCDTTSKTVEYGSPFGELPVPELENHTFLGWYIGNKKITEDSIVSFTYNGTLSAKWEISSYTIKYYGGWNVECYNIPEDQVVSCGEQFNLSSQIPTRYGYTFTHWTDYDDNVYYPSQEYLFDKSTDYSYEYFKEYGYIYMYAEWKVNTYTLFFDANGGTCDVTSKTITFNEPYGTLPVPTRPGYIFKGWYTSKNSSWSTKVTEETVCSDTWDETVYAIWVEDESSPTLESVSVVQKPTKTTYYIGDSLNTSGLKLELTYSDGSTEIITSGFIVSGFSSAYAGIKTIKVTYEDFSDDFIITVNTPSITLSSSSKSMNVGDTASLTATTTPSGQTVTWTSSNTSVATVSNGKITAKAAGTATITAKFTYNGKTYSKTCGVTVSKTVHTHTAGNWIIDKNATCTTAGSKHKECTTCGETIETVTILATGHTSVKDNAIAATCTTAGKTEGSHCSVCNVVIKAQTTIPAKGHTSSAWIVDKNATCTASGSKHKECTVCGVTVQTATIPATGHTAVKDNAIAATCTTAGKTEGSHCSVCNVVIKAQTTIPAKGHTSSAWIVDKNATCTASGSKHKECTVCGVTVQTATIPATGHTAVKDNVVAATCTTAGKTEGSHCSVCNTVIVAQTTIPAKGHTPSAWKVDTETRTRYKECTVCKAVLQRENIPLNAPAITSCYNEVNGVQLKWEAVDGAEKYNVYRKLPAEMSWEQIATVSDIAYRDIKVSGNTVYQYKINAVDQYGGVGEYSAQRECRFIETPTLLTRENAVGGVKITWEKVAGATSYRIYRRGAGTDYWFYLGDFDASLNTFTDLEAANYFPEDANKNTLAKPKSGNYYRYTVRASYDGEDSNGNPYLIYSGFDTNGLYLKYVATPKLTSISNATNGLQIKWKAVNGGGDVEYRVYRRGAGSNYWYYLGTTTNTTWTDEGVKSANGGYYRYTVRAVAGKNGSGWYSAFDTTGLYLMRLANPTLTSVVSSSVGITVKWNSVKGATSYYVYRKTASSGWVRIATVSGNANTTYLDKTAQKGVTYTYTVRAVYGTTTSAYNSGASCYDKY